MTGQTQTVATCQSPNTTRSHRLLADLTTLSPTLRVRRMRVPTKPTFRCSKALSSYEQLIWSIMTGSRSSFCAREWRTTVCCRSLSTKACFRSHSCSSCASTPSKGGNPLLLLSDLSPNANDIGAKERYCIRVGCGRSNKTACAIMLLLAGQNR